MNIEAIKYQYINIQKYLSIILIFLIVLSLCSYIYIINSTILNTVARQQDNREAARISSQISKLEYTYISLRGGINIDLAKSMGFEDNFSQVHFSNENQNVAGRLTLLGNEI